MCTSSQFDLFHVLLTRKDAAEILVEDSTVGVCLPLLTIPTCARIAEELTREVKNRFAIQAYCLLTLPSQDPSPKTAILEVISDSEGTPDGMRWRTVTSLGQTEFENLADFALMARAFTELDRFRRGELVGLFAKPGSLRVVTEWVEAEASSFGIRLTGSFEQLNASPTFSLVRFETNGPALWFKAVGEPNLREYRVTLALSSYFPEYLPRVLAARADWNAWLAVDAKGTHPDQTSDAHGWARVARSLADMQIASYGRTFRFLGIGCRDMRVCTLRSLVEPYFAVIGDLMESQTTKSPLVRDELHTLQMQLQDALDEIAQCEIPNALGHLDFNPGNILVTSNRCLFLDWAEASMGTPFLTFEYLLEHLRRLRPQDDPSHRALTSAYMNRWSDFVSPEQLTRALRLSPLLAVFAFATSIDAWKNPNRLLCADTAKFLRSLTRRIKREANALVLGETKHKRVVPCLS